MYGRGGADGLTGGEDADRFLDSYTNPFGIRNWSEMHLD